MLYKTTGWSSMDKDDMLDKISSQIDVMVSLLKIAYAGQINEVRRTVYEDEIAVKILEFAQQDLPASELVSKVGGEVKQKERTIRYRLSDLIARGVLKVEKVGNKSYYRTTGLI